jgi:hypothetical protein
MAHGKSHLSDSDCDVVHEEFVALVVEDALGVQD